MTGTCNICESPWSGRINGWILSGEPINKVEEWCRLLEPPVAVSRDSLNDHLDQGHIGIGQQQVLSMLVKYNREAQAVIDDALSRPNGMPRHALNTAMSVRMRTIELIAKAVDVIDAGPRTANQSVNVHLTPAQVAQMVTHAAKALLPEPPAKLESSDGTSTGTTPAESTEE